MSKCDSCIYGYENIYGELQCILGQNEEYQCSYENVFDALRRGGTPIEKISSVAHTMTATAIDEVVRRWKMDNVR